MTNNELYELMDFLEKITGKTPETAEFPELNDPELIKLVTNLVDSWECNEMDSVDYYNLSRLLQWYYIDRENYKEHKKEQKEKEKEKYNQIYTIIDLWPIDVKDMETHKTYSGTILQITEKINADGVDVDAQRIAALCKGRSKKAAKRYILKQ